ncbi:hypothetical protein BH11CYA1_BH11CYA1_01500 [soil metagenome]
MKARLLLVALAQQHFKGKLTKARLERLCYSGSSFRGHPFNANYLNHRQAEIDAAAIICKLALHGKLEDKLGLECFL